MALSHATTTIKLDTMQENALRRGITIKGREGHNLWKKKSLIEEILNLGKEHV